MILIAVLVFYIFLTTLGIFFVLPEKITDINKIMIIFAIWLISIIVIIFILNGMVI